MRVMLKKSEEFEEDKFKEDKKALEDQDKMRELILKLCICLLRGLGRLLNVTLRAFAF